MRTPAQSTDPSFNNTVSAGNEGSSGALSTVVTGIVLFLAGAWFLAERDSAAGHTLDGMGWFQLTFKSWFLKYWLLNSAKMFLPAALGFAVGWRAHRRVGSAMGGALAGAAVVVFALWQGVETPEVPKRAPVVVAPKEEPVVAQAASAPAQPKPAEPTAEETADTEAAMASKTLKANAQDEARRARSQVASELELAYQESERQARKYAAKAARTEDPLAILGQRQQVAQPTHDTLGPPSGPGVMPPPPAAVAEKELDHPSFPGCRWENSIKWVCDRKP
jgi:hypothetical protein